MSDTNKFANVIISLIIAGTVLAAGIMYTTFRDKELDTKIIVTLLSSSDIGITNPVTGETHIMKVAPASVKPNPAQRNTNPPASELLSAKSVSHAGIPRLSMDDAKLLYASGQVVFIDARIREDYEAGHIKGAVSMPFGSMPELLPKFRKTFEGKMLVTYCGGSGCNLSEKAAYNLFDNGYERIAIFFGGWENWKEAGMPVSSGAGLR